MIFSCFFVSVFGDGIFIDLWWNMGPIWCQEACAGRFILTRFSSFFRRVYFRLFLCCFRLYFDTLFVDLDCISCRFGLHFGTLLAGLGFFPSVLAPGALPERSWKPSTTPVGFLMICCWIFTSNSMHMSYTLHATRWISDDSVLDFHIEFSLLPLIATSFVLSHPVSVPSSSLIMYRWLYINCKFLVSIAVVCNS